MKQQSILYLAFFLSFWSCEKGNISPTTIPQSPSTQTIQIVEEEFAGDPVVIVGSKGLNFVVSFKRRLADGTILDFDVQQNKLPIILEDDEGNQWDVFGTAVSGPRKGEQLRSTSGYMGYWFAWGSFHPGIRIHEGLMPPENIPEVSPSEGWLVPKDFVFAPTAKDAIPALELPRNQIFRDQENLNQPFYLSNDDLVVGIKINGRFRAYPHAILNWHEIINDTLGGQAFSLIYCPLTGTATAWERRIDGEETTFGVSGILFNNNVVPYDRKTGSYWSQMEAVCIFGENQGNRPNGIQLIETTWDLWKRMYPDPEIISDQTGFQRDYTFYPYGDYITNHDFLSFPLVFDDPRLPRKERVHGVVINGEAKVYPLKSFD